MASVLWTNHLRWRTNWFAGRPPVAAAGRRAPAWAPLGPHGPYGPISDLSSELRRVFLLNRTHNTKVLLVKLLQPYGCSWNCFRGAEHRPVLVGYDAKVAVLLSSVPTNTVCWLRSCATNGIYIYIYIYVYIHIYIYYIYIYIYIYIYGNIF